MHRLVVSLCLFAATATATQAQPESMPGTPEAACEARRNDCIRDERRRYCARPTPARPLAQCLENVETECAKAFEVCLSGTPAQDAPAPPPVLPRRPPPAVQSVACNALFQRVRQLVPIGVLWTTSYHARGERFTGVTPLELRLRGDSLVAEGTRFRNYQTQPVLRPTPGQRQTLIGPSGRPLHEHVTIEIRADGRIVFQGVYGPYQPRCSAERFAIVESGDSVEAFNFNVPAP